MNRRSIGWLLASALCVLISGWLGLFVFRELKQANEFTLLVIGVPVLAILALWVLAGCFLGIGLARFRRKQGGLEQRAAATDEL